MAEQDSFDASPNNKVAGRQMNEALQGIEGRVSGVQGAEIAHKKHEEKDKEKRERMVFAMTSEQIAEAYAEMDRAIINMQANIIEMGKNLVELSHHAHEILNELHDNLAEIETKLLRQQDELKDLEDGLETADDKEYQQVLIDLKKAEIENTQSVQELYQELKESTSESLNQATHKFEAAQESLSDLQELRQAAEIAGNPEEHLEMLSRQIAEAEQNVQNAQDAIKDIENRAELASKIITFGASDLNIESLTCSPIDDELKKIEMTKARTELTEQLTGAIKDGVISQSEASSLMALSSKAGINQENQMMFARSIAKSGIAIEVADGPSLTGAAAETYLLSEFDKLRQEKSQELENIHAHMAKAGARQEATQTEINAQTQILTETTADINEQTTTGSKSEIAAAKLGVASIGENISYVVDVITDANGNEVHIDNSGATDSYYRLDASGDRVDYDPIKDDLQILNFSMGKDGNAPMMTSAQDTIKRFANIELNTDIGRTRASQIGATSSIEKGEVTLAVLSSNISDLKQQEDMVQSDIAKLDEIETQLASGELSIEAANSQIIAMQGDGSNWVKSEGAPPQNNIFANGLTMGSVLDNYPQYAEPNASYAAPINNGTSNTPSLTTTAFGITPEQSEEQKIALQQQMDAKNDPDINSSPSNTGMTG